MAASDFETVLAKLHRANEHAEWFVRVADDFFSDADKYELIFQFKHGTGEIDVRGRFVEPPPLAYLGGVFGDALNCLRSALDHIVWALSRRFQTNNPPPYPIPWSSPWKRLGFPVVTDPTKWNGAVATKLRLIDPALHSRFRELQPFVVNAANPEQAWLAMLDGLWNIDKHHVIHVGNLTLALKVLNITTKSEGRPLTYGFVPTGPQVIDLHAIEAEAHLARLTGARFSPFAGHPLDEWPATTDEMHVHRGWNVNLFLDPGEPGLGKNMEFALGHMHNAVVLIVDAFGPEFT